MPGNRFTDKVVLVTGGTSGLGADTAELFLQEGAKVLVTDLVERDILKRLGDQNADFQKCDISSARDCENAVKRCVERFGRLDILFHNGARLAALANVVDHDVETFESVIKTNLLGQVLLSITHTARQKSSVRLHCETRADLYLSLEQVVLYGSCSGPRDAEAGQGGNR